MNVKEIKVTANRFAYDGCHKIYLLETDDDLMQANEYGWSVLPIEQLPRTYVTSCPLRFINTWGLDTVVPQFSRADFVGWELDDWTIGAVEYLNSGDDDEYEDDGVVYRVVKA